MPIHVVCKESSITMKMCAVFDASATTSTGISLNSTLMVGPTVHPPLIDVLICFRNHRIAVIADVNQMYRAIRQEAIQLQGEMHSLLLKGGGGEHGVAVIHVCWKAFPLI